MNIYQLDVIKRALDKDGCPIPQGLVIEVDPSEEICKQAPELFVGGSAKIFGIEIRMKSMGALSYIDPSAELVLKYNVRVPFGHEITYLEVKPGPVIPWEGTSGMSPSVITYSYKLKSPQSETTTIKARTI